MNVRDADGAVCLDCGGQWDIFTHGPHVPWTWRQAQKMHERGTGHRTTLLRIKWE